SVFELFYDGSTPLSSFWNMHTEGSAGVTLEGGAIKMTSGMGSGNVGNLVSLLALPDSLAFHYSYYLADGKDYGMYTQITPETNPSMVYTAENDYDGLTIHDYYRMAENNHSIMVGGVPMASAALPQLGSEIWHNIMHTHTPNEQSVWMDGALEDMTTVDVSSWGDRYLLVGWAPPWDQSLEMYMDNIFVRQYTAQEPTAVFVGGPSTGPDSTGISLANTPHATISDNEIRGWDIGLNTSNTTWLVVEGNLFADSTDFGVKMEPEDNMVFRENTLEQNGVAISLTTIASSLFRLENCSFLGNTYNFLLADGSHPHSLSCSFDTWSDNMVDPSSGPSADLTVKNYLVVEVYDVGSNPLNGATVWVTDDGDLQDVGLTGANGRLGWIIVADRVIGPGTWTENTTIVNVSSTGKNFINENRPVNMSTSRLEMFFETGAGDGIAPAAPINLAITHDGSAVRISWEEGANGNMDLVHYRIYRSTSPHAPWPWTVPAGWGDILATSTMDLTNSWDDTTEYYYIVRAFDVYDGDSANSTMGAKSVITMGAGLNLVGMDLPIDLIRPDGGFGPEGCKNATLEIQTQNPAVNVLVIRRWTPGGWEKYEPSQEPFTSYFNMYAKEGYFIQLDADPTDEWRVGGLVFESPQTIAMGAGLNLISPPTDLERPDSGFGPEGCKNATTEIEAQNPTVNVLMIRRWTTSGWMKYEPSQEPFTSYFNMEADKGYFIQVSTDPTNEWTTSW
ncbi:MAG: right-handed parallel beta-helix repeat-containing protein, partial [Thermoplasmata archaeon]|nr:right-handed parallel beta-helix repeat-containing protein [Thermoplasmata archaeon]